MEAIIHIAGKPWVANLGLPHPIGIPLRFDGSDPNCFFAPIPAIEPVVAGDFIGSTAKGGAVNFMNVKMNPHGNGTHTECVGHIANQPFFISQTLDRYFFSAKLISVYPQMLDNGDRVILRDQLAEILRAGETEAAIIRTLPNDETKQSRQYSGTNPPYFEVAALQLLVDYGIQHLLTDLPSVDREEDGGALAGHKMFWQYPYSTRTQATITEMVYVDNRLTDGLYLLQMQFASFHLDASPANPVIYPLAQKG
ncbi:MAG: cyclase family protein [Saprospiraceae bacterium]